MISGFYLNSEGTRESFYPLFEKGQKGKLANISIVYGQNGSGKTTLAGALGEEEAVDPCPVMLGDKSREKIKRDSVKRHLFNEEFILSEFRVIKDEVGAIVLLGDDVDNVDAIESLSESNAELQIQIDELEKQEQVLGKSGAGSVNKAKNEFKKALNNAGWGEKYRKIKQVEKAPAYTEVKLNEIVSLFNSKVPDSPVDFNIAESKDELDALIRSILQATAADEAEEIDIRLSKVGLSVDEEQLNEALNKTPPRISGDRLVEAISSAISDSEKNIVASHARKILVEDHADQCPLCFQLIDDEHRRLLTEALAKVYNTDRENLELRLKQLRENLDTPSIELQEEVEAILPSDRLVEFKERIAQVETEQNKIQKSIDEKLEELETRAIVSLEPLIQAIDRLNSLIVEANDLIKSHNKTVSNLQKVTADALELNDLVCGFEARSELLNFVGLRKTAFEVSEVLSSKRAELKSNLEKIDSLNSEHRNTTDAIKLINSFMRIIFAEEERLELSPVGAGYSVSCRGVRLKPFELSTGERNILALSYFFASVFKSIPDFNDPSGHRVVILDDPLSSFDEDNRFGVLIFLKQMTDRIAATGGGQVVFFTHDARFVFNLSDAFKTSKNVSVITHRLNSRELTTLNLDGSNTYKVMLERILSYALLGTDHSPVKDARTSAAGSEMDLVRMDLAKVHKSSVPSGNELRQVLEAYSEFNFGKNISELMEDPIVRETLELTGETFSAYFGSSLYKLFLHGESHTTDSIRVGNYGLTPLAKDEDRIFFCREILCLLSALTPEHVAGRLNLSSKKESLGHFPQTTKFNDYLVDWGHKLEERALPTL